VQQTLPQVDQVELGRIRNRVSPSSLVLEVDVFPVHGAAIDSEEGPFIPASPLIVEAGSGMILGQDLCHPRDRYAALQVALLNTIGRLEALPQVVLVGSSSVREALAPVCAGLDIGIELVDSLPTLEPARESLTNFMMGGGL
jgi:hypothetical protein